MRWGTGGDDMTVIKYIAAEQEKKVPISIDMLSMICVSLLVDNISLLQ